MRESKHRFPEVECKRCGWKWIPRVKHPVACPDCLSRKWDEEETNKTTSVATKTIKQF